MQDDLLTGITEKPVYRSMVNAGIYVLESEVFRHLQRAFAIQAADEADEGRGPLL